MDNSILVKYVKEVNNPNEEWINWTMTNILMKVDLKLIINILSKNKFDRETIKIIVKTANSRITERLNK